MQAHGLGLLRFGLGLVFIWFGAPKLVPGLSPAEDLVVATLPCFDRHWCVPLLGLGEVLIGLCLLYRPWIRVGLFLMAGQIEERPVVEDGQVVPRKTLHIRWSYDERIDDGLTSRFGIESVKRALENPREYLGCLAEDGNDARPLGAGAGMPEA